MWVSIGQPRNLWVAAIANWNLRTATVVMIVLMVGGDGKGQKSPACNGCPALNAPVVTLPKFPDDRVVMDTPDSPKGRGERQLCWLEPFAGLANTTSVDRLKISARAQSQYRAACAALKRNRLAASEQHVRKAIQIYPKYAAGWVMLGQLLEAQQRADPAREACWRATEVDPRYLPSYLCLAQIAGRAEQWEEVLRYTGQALQLDPVHDAYAYFFSAIAFFNLNRIPDAEQRALKAEELDVAHREPRVQFLLGQIYKVKNDPVKAAVELREFLKYAPGAPDSDAVKQDLAKIENELQEK